MCVCVCSNRKGTCHFRTDGKSNENRFDFVRCARHPSHYNSTSIMWRQLVTAQKTCNARVLSMYTIHEINYVDFQRFSTIPKTKKTTDRENQKKKKKKTHTRKEYEHGQQQHAEQNHHDGGAFPCAARRQTLAEVERRGVVMRWGAAHGAARRQHRPRVAAIVALQCVFGGRRARRPAFVFDRRSFVDICGKHGESRAENKRTLISYLTLILCVCVCTSASGCDN